jgi:hypothetical protein
MTALHVATAAGLHTVGRGGEDALDGLDATTLAAGGGALWALTRHRRIWRIVDGKAELVARVEGAIAWCLLWHAGALWVGTDEAGLLRLGDGALERVAGFDRAPGRETWQQPVARPATTWSLASDGARLYVNVHVGGILRSDDGGASFAPTIEIDDDVHEVSVAADGRLLAATGEKGLAVSVDRGVTWTHHAEGLHAPYLSCAVPTADGALVAASSGYACEDDAIYRFGGHAFERCTKGLPGRFGGFLGARRLAAQGRAAAVADAEGRLYVSQDAGRSWTIAAEGLPSVRAIVIRAD